MHSRHPLPSPAGTIKRVNDNASTTARCLVFPTTTAPSTTARHRGPHQNLLNKTYKAPSKSAHHSASSMTSVLPSKVPTDHALWTLEKAEGNYTRVTKESLGKAFKRHVVFPHDCHDPAFRFGVANDTQRVEHCPDLAKGLIYGQALSKANPDTMALRGIKNPPPSEPGMQSSRHYNWTHSIPFPATHVFGKVASGHVKSPTVADSLVSPDSFNSVLVAYSVEAKRTATRAPLGQVKGSQDTTYATRSRRHETVKDMEDSTAGCLQSHACPTRCDEAEATSLGVATSFGWRNLTTDTRPFGVPTCRRDIVPPSRRSLADTTNYGGRDSVTAQTLLYPEPTSALNGATAAMSTEEYTCGRDLEMLKTLFRTALAHRSDVCQVLAQDATCDALFEQASALDGHYGQASMQAFQQVLEAWMDHLKEDRTREC